MKSKSVLSIVLVSIVLAGCAGSSPSEPETPGVLQGSVSIGPICPVEQEGVPCPVPPEAYAARKIVVSDSRGRLVERVTIGSDGRYRVSLAPGTYRVDINRIGIDSSSDVPRTVTIRSGETVVLDIRIDTGIR
jgi:hypothetical protein